jgi:N-acetylmuramoyl-L-alanine amidase
MIRNKVLFLFVVLFLFTGFPVIYAQERGIPRQGEGIHAFLKRNNREENIYYKEFIRLNKNKLGKNNSLLKGVKYILPPLSSDVPKETPKKTESESNFKSSGKNLKQPLFGSKYENFTKIDNILDGACFFLVSGHGGPDPGACANVDGYELHEDEYAYDIVLRLARNLLQHGATVHIIIQDKKDGIRDGKYLSNSKRETCMGSVIPLNQIKRLRQRADKINSLSKNSKAKYQRAIFIHLDSRSKKEQLDVFFYYQNGKRKSQNLAETMRTTFRSQYEKHQPGRGFSGTVTTRNLAVLRNTDPVSIFVELANMLNSNDQKRYVWENNRQALANWLAKGFMEDYLRNK